MGVPQLFLQLTPNNKFQSMKENIQFLKDNKSNYGQRLEGVILHIEQYKMIGKQEILDDIMELLRKYLNPSNSNLNFYVKLLEIKISQLMQQNNLNYEAYYIVHLLEKMSESYYSINPKFSDCLINISNKIKNLEQQRMLLKKKEF